MKSKVLPRSLYLLIGLVFIAFFIWGWLDHFSLASGLNWETPDTLIDSIRYSGVAGPSVIVAAMAIAVVISPFPSAPIAMAAGVIYGHYEGTLYVFIGALLGASIAFGIARGLGFALAQEWLDRQLPAWKLDDQKRLMWLVMMSRLVPFISFDLVSYAAGITKLNYWRFVIATALGILPASFALAHFGEMAKEQSLFINGLLVLILLVAAGVWQLSSKKSPK